MPSSEPQNAAQQAALRAAGDLEECLKAITPNKQDHKGLRILIEKHDKAFSDLPALIDARVIRNWIMHRDHEVSDAQARRAKTTFENAVQEVLRHPNCPEDLRQRFKTESPPPPQERTPDPEPPILPPPQPSARPSAAASPPPRHHKPKREKVWFVLAAAFLIVGIFAYVVRPQSKQTNQTGEVHAAPRTSPSQPPNYIAPGWAEQKPSSTAGPNREEQFAKLINTNLSTSTSQPNVAVAIVASGPGTSEVVVDALQGFLSGANLHLIFNLADINSLVTGGFFDDMYSGNGQLTSRAAQLSRVDYILLGKASYSFRRQANLDPDLLACDLTLTCRLIDRTGTTVQSSSFIALGPGFTEPKALDAAAVAVAKQVNEKILGSIR